MGMKAKIAATISQPVVDKLDEDVVQGKARSRSERIEALVKMGWVTEMKIAAEAEDVD